MEKRKALLSLLLAALLLTAAVITSCSNTTVTETGDATSSETEPEEEDETPKLSGEYAKMIENAKRLENGVNSYYATGSRDSYIVENSNMLIECLLRGDGKQITAIKNRSGGKYIENTSDVYVKTADGTYFSANSAENATANLFRFGYYYYDVRIKGQSFSSEATVTDEMELPLKGFNRFTDVSKGKMSGGILKFTVDSVVDPSVGSNVNFNTEDFNALQITMKSSGSSNGYLYVGCPELSDKDMIRFGITNDGEFHTYTIMLNDFTLTNYKGKCSYLRIDIDGVVGEEIEISSVKAVNIDSGGAPAVFLDRNLNVYSDKLHQVIHIVAPETVKGIEEIGTVTKVKADTVAKVIFKDKNGTHDSLDGVDQASLLYAGFDIASVGIFGYILPSDKSSGTMTVELTDGYYVITQATAPKDNTIYKSQGTSRNDFYMGHRLYTDASHEFDAFILAAETEIAPLTAENIKVDTDKTPDAAFEGYDRMRGYYRFTLPGTAAFSDSYFTYPNRHYGVSFTVNGDEYERTLYVQTFADSTNIECAALLSEDDMMLPLAIEVAKNFAHEHEEPLFDNGDNRYSETYFPLAIGAKDSKSLTLLNLYQNWGVFPLKQISSIQFYMPYYHLSTGTTETNCIAPYYVSGKNLLTLPDHRAMSAPFWFDIPSHSGGSQPQHTAGGAHSFLQYTDANGVYSASDVTELKINSYGPTYSSVDCSYISDDGRIKVVYTHEEMPQTDENRAYYTMRYEVLEDITFNDFKSDFAFYSVKGYGEYSRVGYLDENNQSALAYVNKKDEAEYYTLGNECPYFDFFKLVTGTVDDYVNVAFLIKDSKVTLGGEQSAAPFIVKDINRTLSLSLDLGSVTLKKGDTIEINAIIMPWGSQLTDYSSDEPDKNVRDVRENSLLDICKVSAEVGSVIETEFLPSIMSDGKTATFTVSGGHNNMAVRVYGFDKLTAPVIEEKINGEWVEYTVNSSKTPDSVGYCHYYDGYTVYYDGDGTFSYAFIVAMDNGKDRTFRITADKDFEEWPEIEVPDQPGNDSDLDILVSPSDMEKLKASSAGFSDIVLSEDGEYISFYGSGAPEAYITVYQDGIRESGAYGVIRYRVRGANNVKGYFMEMFTSTVEAYATGTGDHAYTDGVITDGEWHILVIDLNAFGLSSFKPDEDGKYFAKYIRFDAFNTTVTSDVCMDIAYIGMCNSIDDVKKMASDLGSFTVTKGIGDANKTVVTLD